MIASEQKPLEEILEYLADERRVFILACDGCSAGCKVSTAEEVARLSDELSEHGKEITGCARSDFACNQAQVVSILARHLPEISAADGVLVLSCGVGIQSVAAAVEKRVHPGTNSVSLGGYAGLWRSEARCATCGDCLLDYTGGICPITACSKSLINGICGGSDGGKCEVRPDIECGWARIYERLESLGRTDLLRRSPRMRDFKRMIPTAERRGTSLFALEREPY
jgi:hypothetical protein